MLRLYRPGNILIFVDGITGTMTLLSSRGADSTFFSKGKDSFLKTLAIEANSNWIVADGARLRCRRTITSSGDLGAILSPMCALLALAGHSICWRKVSVAQAGHNVTQNHAWL